MKKIILSISLFLFGMAAFSQTIKENGTIYVNHPYIDTINNSAKYYLTRDTAANRKIYSDTATLWASGMTKPMGISAAIKMWASDFDYFDSIKLVPVGYPDYLHYIDGDAKIVQSWWKWSGKSKKTDTWV